MSESRKNRKYATISGSYLKIILKPPQEIVAKENKDCGDVWIGERTYFIAGFLFVETEKQCLVELN